jgi:hypothetical protein
LWILAFAWFPRAAAQTLPQIISRLSEEAEVFAHVAPQVLAEETLTQRATRKTPRFHPRLGDAATKTVAPVIETREIVSEYSFGMLAAAPEALHEFREVVSVDGRPVSAPGKARVKLVLGLRSADDRARKSMLEKFARHGLATAVTDFGPLLLLFAKRQIGDYHFEMAGEERLGADRARVVTYRQVAGPERLVVFQGREAIHQKIEGRIDVREPDGLPLRITMTETRAQGKLEFRDEASVDYVMNARGFLAPAAVTHRGYTGDKLMVEDNFRYTTFRMFAADAEIKFDAAPP